MSHIPAALRRLVHDRAGGACEYCLVPESMALVAHEVDHVIALKHGGDTAPDNLALSCALCNKHKGSDIASIDAETGELVPLFNPRTQQWDAHFSLHGARLDGLTPTGRATRQLLQLNHPQRLVERELLLAANLIRR